jgi:hypothetical protein
MEVSPDTTVEEVRDWMHRASEKAWSLYAKAREECIPEHALDPVQWIYNQTSVRAIWRASDQTAGGALSEYMAFMYDSYAPGWGDRLRVLYSFDHDIDFAEQYREYLLQFRKKNE